MEIIEKLKSITNDLDELQEYTDNLSSELSVVDSRICDLEHFIEHNKINSKNAYRICKEMQSILLQRRKIKNDMELSRVLNLNIDKIKDAKTRQFLAIEINKANGKLNKPYNNRVYNQKEEDYLLGKENDDSNETESCDEIILGEC